MLFWLYGYPGHQELSEKVHISAEVKNISESWDIYEYEQFQADTFDPRTAK